MAELDQALAHHQAGRLQAAEAIYRRILAREPEQAEALHLLGVVTHQRGHHEQAVSLIERALNLRPVVPEYHNNLGEALRALGRLDQAVSAYDRALALRPAYREARNNLGLALQAQGRLTEAALAFQRALAIAPDAETECNLAEVLRAQGKLDAAIAAYERAVAIRPDFAEGYNNLGAALQQQGKLDAAIAALRRALALRPDYAQALYNLGVALEDQGQIDEAIAAYRRATAAKLDMTSAHYNLGLALQKQGELALAIGAYERLLALAPQDLGTLNNLGHALLMQGKVQEAIGVFQRALRLKADFADAHSNLLLALHYRAEVSPEEILAETGRWAKRHASLRMNATPFRPYDTRPERRLRIGYLSPDFRSHSVAFFIEPVLAAHDRQAFEVYGYANVAHPDAVSERLKGLADHWRSVVGLSDEQVVAQIREGRIDILIDLAGHTAGNRLLVLARKPAPIQVAYLGYPDTRGLATIDYWLTDRYADPPGESERFYVEEVIRLPRGFSCYQPPLKSPEVGPLPAPTAGYMTFGSFNNASKVNEQVIALWAEILRALPRARLLLKARALADAETRERLARAFEKEGVGREHFELISWLPGSAAHLALYQRIDIALDPFPYNGHTTTCEALWMGVPVIALAGKTHAGRVGVSLLTHAGVPELIAKSPEDYINIAVALASDLERLRVLRAGLRAQLQRSSLMDAVGFTRALEAAYRGMWEKYCAASGK